MEAVTEVQEAVASYATILKKNLDPALAVAAHTGVRLPDQMTEAQKEAHSAAITLTVKRQKNEIQHKMDKIYEKIQNLPKTKIYYQYVEKPMAQASSPDAVDLGINDFFQNPVPMLHVHHKWIPCPSCKSEKPPNSWIRAKGVPKKMYFVYPEIDYCDHHSGRGKRLLKIELQNLAKKLEAPHREYTRAVVSLSRNATRNELISSYYQECEEIVSYCEDNQLPSGGFTALTDLTWKISDALFNHAPKRSVIRASLEYFQSRVWRDLCQLVDGGETDLYLVDVTKNKRWVPASKRDRLRVWLPFDPTKAVLGKELTLKKCNNPVFDKNDQVKALSMNGYISTSEIGNGSCAFDSLAILRAHQEADLDLEHINDIAEQLKEEITDASAGGISAFCVEHNIWFATYHRKANNYRFKVLVPATSRYMIAITNTDKIAYHAQPFIFSIDQSRLLEEWFSGEKKKILGADIPMASPLRDTNRKLEAEAAEDDSLEIDLDDLTTTPVPKIREPREPRVASDIVLEAEDYSTAVRASIVKEADLLLVADLLRKKPYMKLVTIYEGERKIDFDSDDLNSLFPHMESSKEWTFESDDGFILVTQVRNMQELQTILVLGRAQLSERFNMWFKEASNDREQEFPEFCPFPIEGARFVGTKFSTWSTFYKWAKPAACEILDDDFLFRCYVQMPKVEDLVYNAVRCKAFHSKFFSRREHFYYKSTIRFENLNTSAIEALYEWFRHAQGNPIDARGVFNLQGKPLVSSGNVVNCTITTREAVPEKLQRLSLLDIAMRLLTHNLIPESEVFFNRWDSLTVSCAQESIKALSPDVIADIFSAICRLVTGEIASLLLIKEKLFEVLQSVVGLVPLIVELYSTQRDVYMIEKNRSVTAQFGKAANLAMNLASVIPVSAKKTDEEVYALLLEAAVARDSRASVAYNNSPIATSIDPSSGCEIELAVHMAMAYYYNATATVEATGGQRVFNDTGVTSVFQ